VPPGTEPQTVFVFNINNCQLGEPPNRSEKPYAFGDIINLNSKTQNESSPLILTPGNPNGSILFLEAGTYSILIEFPAINMGSGDNRTAIIQVNSVHLITTPLITANFTTPSSTTIPATPYTINIGPTLFIKNSVLSIINKSAPSSDTPFMHLYVDNECSLVKVTLTHILM